MVVWKWCKANYLYCLFWKRVIAILIFHTFLHSKSEPSQSDKSKERISEKEESMSETIAKWKTSFWVGPSQRKTGFLLTWVCCLVCDSFPSLQIFFSSFSTTLSATSSISLSVSVAFTQALWLVSRWALHDGLGYLRRYFGNVQMSHSDYAPWSFRVI